MKDDAEGIKHLKKYNENIRTTPKGSNNNDCC